VELTMTLEPKPKPPTPRTEYLGDGIYASFDGWHVWLGLDSGQRLIALEPSVLGALIGYARRCHKLED
jgi:hypothetical protein